MANFLKLLFLLLFLFTFEITDANPVESGENIESVADDVYDIKFDQDLHEEAPEPEGSNASIDNSELYRETSSDDGSVEDVYERSKTEKSFDTVGEIDDNPITDKENTVNKDSSVVLDNKPKDVGSIAVDMLNTDEANIENKSVEVDEANANNIKEVVNVEDNDDNMQDNSKDVFVNTVDSREDLNEDSVEKLNMNSIMDSSDDSKVDLSDDSNDKTLENSKMELSEESYEESREETIENSKIKPNEDPNNEFGKEINGNSSFESNEDFIEEPYDKSKPEFKEEDIPKNKVQTDVDEDEDVVFKGNEVDDENDEGVECLKCNVVNEVEESDEAKEECICETAVGFILSKQKHGAVTYTIPVKAGEILVTKVSRLHLTSSCSLQIGDVTYFPVEIPDDILISDENDVRQWNSTLTIIVIKNDMNCSWNIMYEIKEPKTPKTVRPLENDVTVAKVSINGIFLGKLTELEPIKSTFESSVANIVNSYGKEYPQKGLTDNIFTKEDVHIDTITDCNPVFCWISCVRFTFTVSSNKTESGVEVDVNGQLLDEMVRDPTMQQYWEYEGENQICQDEPHISWGFLGMEAFLLLMIAIVLFFVGSQAKTIKDYTGTNFIVPIQRSWRKKDKEVKEPPGWTYNISGFDHFDAIDPRAVGLEEDPYVNTPYTNIGYNGDDDELYTKH